MQKIAMITKRSVNWFILCLFFFLLFISVAFAAGTPTEAVRATADKVLSLLRDGELKSKAKEHRQQLREAIYPRFDFVEMARRSLGPHWRDLPPTERKEFVETFRDLLEDAYVDAIESYSGEKIKFKGERRDGEFSQVDTTILGNKGQEYSVNYRLHLKDGEWKIYDVVLEGISLVNNYRSQFKRVLTKSSYEDLLHRLKEKQLERPRRKTDRS